MEAALIADLAIKIANKRQELENILMPKAPWTPEQVAKLNEWQDCRWIHPFTCGNRSPATHVAHPDKDLGQLIATPDGWVCPDCDYTQDWAHDFMFNGAPPEPWHFMRDKK